VGSNPNKVNIGGRKGTQPLKGVLTWEKLTSLFVDSEAYHEQMGPIPSSNGSVDIALSNAHT